MIIIPSYSLRILLQAAEIIFDDYFEEVQSSTRLEFDAAGERKIRSLQVEEGLMAAICNWNWSTVLSNILAGQIEMVNEENSVVIAYESSTMSRDNI
jgi:hypothetical protein